jgi:hypothetical protein
LKDNYTSGPEALRAICGRPECAKKRLNACGKTLKCNHFCCGIKNETKCPPCLQCTDKANDFCNICYIETLSQAPCVQLKCGHILHYECVYNKLKAGWPGARITFGFLNCPVCNTQKIDHVELRGVLKPLLKLHKEIETMCMKRLKHEGRDKCDDIIKENGKFYKNPLGYAMHNFAYYMCYECKKPYFGGMRRCDMNLGDGNENFNEKELICGSCCAKKFKNTKSCAKHDTQFIEYKCKFCCNIATWFCWGTTHFCEECHQKQIRDQSVTKMSKDKLPKCKGRGKCPSGGMHPENGEEFALGCALCRHDTNQF